MIELFEHNEIAYESMNEMHEYENRAAIVHPTGTGKMYITVKWLYENRNKKCLFLCPTKAVMYQLKETIEACGLSLKDFPNLKLALYSHLLNWNTEDYEEKYDCIVLDEFHRAGAKEWGKCVNTLLEYNEDAKVLGLSATPTRYMDKKNMVDDLFEGNVASEITLAEAIAQDLLPFPNYVTCVYYLEQEISKRQEMINECQDEKKKEYLQNLLEQAKRHLENAEGLDEIVKEHVKEKGKVIVFCKDINHIEEMKDKVLSSLSHLGEVEEYIVHSKLKEEENEETLNRYKQDSDKVQVMFAVDKLTEGYHLKGIKYVFMLRKTDSHIVYLQQLGRGLSVKGNIPTIIDVADNIEAYENIYDVRDEIFEYLGYENYNDERIPVELKEKFRIFGYTKDIVNILKQIDFMYRPVLSFEEKIEIIKEYLKDYKYENIMLSTKYNGYLIGRWKADWRSIYNRGKMAEQKERILRNLGETFERKNAKELTFEEKIEILKEFLKKHKFKEIKYRTQYNGYYIGVWKNQWRNRFYQQRLSEIEENILRELGETFERKKTKELTFEEKIEILKKYLKEHRYEEIVQRTQYNGYNIGHWKNDWRFQNSQGRLSEIEENILRELGETFERKKTKELTFEEKLKILKEYLKEHRYEEIAQRTQYNGHNIGFWQSGWRKKYIQGKLSREEELLLKNLGETFEQRKNTKLTFEEKLKVLQEYLQKHKYGDIKSRTKYNGYDIGGWKSDWRYKNSKGNLSETKKNILISLGETFEQKRNVKNLSVNKIPTENVSLDISSSNMLSIDEDSKKR